MRRPRIEDYDPNAKLPELATPIDGMPVIGKPPQTNGVSSTNLPEKTVIQEEQPKRAIPERVNARTPVRPNGKRIITRNAFEIYEDQMDGLRKLSLQVHREITSLFISGSGYQLFRIYFLNNYYNPYARTPER
jgi:hypothetical protein